MTRENKVRLLAAYDALNAIASGGVDDHPPVVHHSHGGSAFCDVCHHSLADATPHTCPVGRAIGALSALVPAWDQRDAWLAEDAAGKETTK